MTNIGNSIPGQWSNPPLKAVYINCSLSANATESHTQRLIERSAGIMTTEGVQVTIIHALEHQIPFGMATDMTQHGAARDDWPTIQAMIDEADILVLGTPIWLGVKSSVATLVVERMTCADDDADVGAGQGGRVVDAIADHRDREAPSLEFGQVAGLPKPGGVVPRAD